MRLRTPAFKVKRKAFLIFLALFVFGAKTFAASGLDPAFDATSLSYDVTEVQTVVQPDGKILISGIFDRVNGIRRYGFARLNADGTLDESFNANGNNFNSVDSTQIRAVKVQPDGKILVGGSFRSYRGTPVAGLIRLNSDGTLDTTFQNNNAADVSVMELQADGKILIGNSIVVARLNSNGSIDTTFTSSTAIRLIGLFLLSNGKIIVTRVTDKGATFSKRLNSDGSFDADLSLGFNVVALQELPDAKFLAGGASLRRFNADGSSDSTFTSSNGFIGDIELTADNKILIAKQGSVVRLLSNGTIDTTFDFAANTVLTGDITLQTDGRIIVSGNAPSAAPPSVPRAVARLLPNGAVDTTFNVILSKDSGVIRNVGKVIAQPDNKVLVIADYLASDGQTRRGIVRLNADGKRDASFTPFTSSGFISDFRLLQNGNIIVAVSSSVTNDIFVQRLSADGTPDNSFSSAVNGSFGYIFGITEQPDGKILLTGDWSSPEARRNIVRLNADGSLDSSYVPSAFGNIFDKSFVQANGKILATRRMGDGLVRFNSDGTPDATFNPQISGKVLDLSIQPDGKIIIGGEFNFIFTGGKYLARLNADGTKDDSFAPVIDSSVRTLNLQRDNKILISGLFTKVNDLTRNRLARLNPNGSTDAAFDSSASTSSIINDIEIQADGKILLGGDKIEVFGETRFGVIRLLNSIASPFDFDGDGKSDISVFRPSNSIWYLLRSQSGFSAAQFGVSTDRLAPADFDGDGRTDLAVYRPSNGEWSIRRSSDDGLTILNFGAPEDLPRPGDFDGDGRAEIAVWRPSTGVWYRLNSSDNQFVAVQFGAGGDAPVIADFDGDGKSDYAVFRPSNGVWYSLNGSDNRFGAVQFGLSEDKPAVGDFDGDGKTDFAVFRPSNGVWYLLQSRAGFAAAGFGQNGDVPTVGDFDGDGVSDISVFRPATGVWYFLNSRSGFSAAGFGQNADKPIPSAFIP